MIKNSKNGDKTVNEYSYTAFIRRTKTWSFPN